MSFKFMFAALTLWICAACNQPGNTVEPGKEEPTDSTGGEMKAMIPESACYAGTLRNDSFFMKMEVFPNVVTGKLEYNFSEKDSNHGDIDGTLHGDTLIADYTFSSEGTSSVRQVAFLVRNDSVVEGYGPMEEKNGKMVFTDLDKLSFSGTPLIKTDCGGK